MVQIGNVWMELTDGGYWEPRLSEIQTEEQARRELPKDMNHRYYLTTWNNTAMIQTGHSSGQSTEDERKVLANTLFYLKQLTKKTEVLDNSASDIADPNKPSDITTVINDNNSTSVRFRRPEDNGSTYEYYVKGLDGSREFTSDTKSATITTGVKKYKYIVDENATSPNHEAFEERGIESNTIGENEEIAIGNIVYNDSRAKYIHIYAIDGAGNTSEVYTQKLEPTSEELEVTKEVVNPKNEYKVGDRITYKVSVRIKENEINRGTINNVSIIDTYNSTYLKLIKESIVKDSNSVVNTDSLGTISSNIGSISYGQVKEIQYDMEILDTANRKI